MNLTPESQEELSAFLRNSLVAVVATVNEGGKPEAALVQCLVDVNFNVYFVTRRHTRKFKNLEQNKGVAITIGTELGATTVQIEGDAELVSEDLADIEALTDRKAMKDIYYGALLDSPFTHIEGKDFAIFRVQPTWLRWMRLDRETGNEMYCQVIPEEKTA